MMKFTSLALTILAMSAPVYSAVDYTYCQQQFNLYSKSNKPCKDPNAGAYGCITQMQSLEDMGKKTADSSYYPFELTADGKIKPHPTLNYQMKDGKEIISSTNKDMDYNTIIARNDKGEITEITSGYNIKTQMPSMGYGPPPKLKQAAFIRKNESTTKFEIKNGKCIPSRIESLNSLGDEAKQEINFDAKLCRNVGQFFKKNPEAASCFDSALMSKAQGMFDDYYKDNADIYGTDKADQFSPKTPLKTKLKSTSNRMYGYPGMGTMGGVGVGMGMGMPGATTEQMLASYMPSIDSIIGGPQMQGMNGFGNSPVLQAMQLQSICQNMGYGMGDSRNFLTDESVWKAEAPASVDATNSVTK
ncbi:MAG: hypothetical protein H7336_12635 [Bacteriovorax sp.]|nr:hypothetical protein [Bacteriovorax sp.]